MPGLRSFLRIVGLRRRTTQRSKPRTWRTACAGYRVTAKTGHHKIAFFSAHLALGAEAKKYGDHFETCRRKRNVIDYTRSHVATETEAKEIVEKSTEFSEFVESWIDSRFPTLKRRHDR
ncbi:MAG TPA: hypothetical protein VG222_18850 [Vicinamibacterales bacterium]|jgi:hypothetical protein|nr:hypothetical protein [Vicinamibacterales bacterium]